ncbi:DUF2971 domain-containing protein [Pseudomonas syringae]|uniref:DUF2971 domain-containing protein n=1 Tax=Pseudomonas syringae pv. syringae (strain B728a) TaxID=205918 RepID=Q4ZSK9_PSEU2|nr:DUF2971 domain-containing protein [Pseudomonas syringae]AAY37863.1 conserved hypothetical protein [Pseudomonas syringae pv. syringae B728a]PYD18415.1 DUF2971 domain-containing protein [Pseudomonas syringae pv. syringae]
MSGKYLYKYVAFDEELNVLKILTENKIKFSAPSAFNDPFDCNPCYVTNRDPIKSRPDLFRFADGSGSPADKIKRKQEGLNRIESAFKDGTFQAKSMRNVGVLSLSRSPWHVLMWAHYAKHHTGFVVEFFQQDWLPRDKSSRDDSHLVSFPVRYSTERPTVNMWSDRMEDEVEKIFMAKSTEWSYEEEERVIDFVNGASAQEFEPRILKSVIAGVNISDAHLKLLKNAVKAFNKKWNARVELYKAKMHDRHYRLVIPDFKR